MSVTITLFMLWLIGVPGVTWGIIFVGMFADACNHLFTWFVGWRGER